MNTAEEQLWDYIDGLGDDAFRRAIEIKIREDKIYANLYAELLSLQQQLQHIGTDEPSMSFNRNVMELIRQEPAPVSLKTKTDRRIILGIGLFFVFIITAILGYAISESYLTISTLHTTLIKVDFDQFISPTLIRGFVFVDLVIGLLYADRLLRKKRMS